MEPFPSSSVPHSTFSELPTDQLNDEFESDLSLTDPTKYPYYNDQEILINGTWNDSLQCWYDQLNNVTVCEPIIEIPNTDLYPTSFKVCIAVLYNFIFVLALFGNAMVCYVVFSSPRMRTVTNYLIANLAVGDLLMAVLCVPFSYIPILLQYWPFGNFLCYLLSPAQAITVLVSSYTLVALAADRYMAILYPLRPRLRRSQACWVIVVVWVVAIVTASPIAIFTEHIQDNVTGNYYCEESGWRTMGAEKFRLPYSLALMVLQYFFPLTVLIFTYSRIAMAVWGKKSLGEPEDSHHQRLAKTKRKMIKMMLTVVLVYTVSWLPINVFLVCGDIWPRTVYFENPYFVAFLFPSIHWLAMSHTVWNPLIYCYMNSRFRDGFRIAISNVWCVTKIARLFNCNLPNGYASRYSSYTANTKENSKRRKMSYDTSNRNGNKRASRDNLKRTRAASLEPNRLMSCKQQPQSTTPSIGVPVTRYPISKDRSIVNGTVMSINTAANIAGIRAVPTIVNQRGTVDIKQSNARTTRFRRREYSSNSSSDCTTGTTSSSSLSSLHRRQSERFNVSSRFSGEVLTDKLQTLVRNSGSGESGSSSSYVTVLNRFMETSIDSKPVGASLVKAVNKGLRRQYSESFI